MNEMYWCGKDIGIVGRVDIEVGLLDHAVPIAQHSTVLGA